MFFACLLFRFLLPLCRLAALKKVNFQPKGNFRAIALKMPVHICMFVVAFLNWPKKMLKGNVAHTWILVWGLAWLGLTPSLALNLPWASLLPSPNFPSRVCRNIYFNPEYGRWWFMSWYWNVKISRELLRENIKKSFFGQNLNICSWSRLVRSCSALLCAEPKRVLLSLCESHVVFYVFLTFLHL